ncbi:hypothetical protein OBBRIDRAFT_805956 [Obba rivulosa]|uniref:Uncharacterized protein n=1 Tax=Obba rivulosa TaxID=1052685 RepID=A0A8E2DHX6_9APHY|nr:hypothetical protein OBBRIDRAFT_805956 [Obba rivulosa]
MCGETGVMVWSRATMNATRRSRTNGQNNTTAGSLLLPSRISEITRKLFSAFHTVATVGRENVPEVRSKHGKAIIARKPLTQQKKQKKHSRQPPRILSALPMIGSFEVLSNTIPDIRAGCSLTTLGDRLGNVSWMGGGDAKEMPALDGSCESRRLEDCGSMSTMQIALSVRCQG